MVVIETECDGNEPLANKVKRLIFLTRGDLLMTATQKHDIISMCTTVLSADQQPKEDKMLDQQKIRHSLPPSEQRGCPGWRSNSIANQRALLTRYAHDHGYTNLKILVDDGYTGTNFNRPGVQEGFALVKQGLVGCWLVKDLSRFGRDYLTVGQYTDIIFPSYDVRFIAVNDGVDSKPGETARASPQSVICSTSGIPVIPARRFVSVCGREEPAARHGQTALRIPLRPGGQESLDSG